MLSKSLKGGSEIKPEEIIAFLGKGTRFKGVITYNGTIRVDGEVEGEIISKGTLVVGEDATINATINVGSIIASGKINGNVTARERIHLMHPAVHNGSLKTPTLIIEEGVRFNGDCEMNPLVGGSPNNQKEIEMVGEQIDRD